MPTVKENIASNIVELRKRKQWTQAELAEYLNYTDKAVSKWERGESTPDAETLYQMAELFGVTVDFFFHNDSVQKEHHKKRERTELSTKLIKLALVLVTVWLVGTVIFVSGTMYIPDINGLWLSFIWPVPVCFAVITFFLKRNRISFLLPYAGSFLLWTLLTAVFLQFLVTDLNFWSLFLVGIPVEAVIILTYCLRKK